VPAAASALGKVLLAHLGADDLTNGPSGDRLDASEKETVRRDGYSYVANDVEAGFHSIAVPVRRWDGHTVAALNLGCNMEGIAPASMRSEVLADLRKEAQQLERQLL
jgi:IclR family pca regulon transcriptional regulator